MNSAAFKRGLHDGVPIGLGYFAVSFTFGMMAAAGGISAGAAVLISLTNLTSAGQFAGIEIIFASGSLWEMALTQLVINLRYCLMSFSLSQKLERGTSTGHRLLVAFGVTDEIFGVSASQDGRVSPWYNYGGNSGMDAGNSGRGSIREPSAGLSGQCFKRGNLRHVSCCDHTTGKEKQGSPWSCDRSNDIQYSFCGCTGIKKCIGWLCDHHYNGTDSRSGSVFLPGFGRGGVER